MSLNSQFSESGQKRSRLEVVKSFHFLVFPVLFVAFLLHTAEASSRSVLSFCVLALSGFSSTTSSSVSSNDNKGAGRSDCSGDPPGDRRVARELGTDDCSSNGMITIKRKKPRA